MIMEEMIKIKKWWLSDKFLSHLFIVLFAFLLYGNSILNEYALDDGAAIANNPFTLKGFEGIPELFKYDLFTPGQYNENTEYYVDADQAQHANNNLIGGRYRPLSLVTFAVEVGLFGTGHPHLHHFFNIIWYILCTFLLYKVLLRLFPPLPDRKWWLTMPFVASILFLAHPVHTEVVANLKSRDEIVALMGVLGALWFTIRWHEMRQQGVFSVKYLLLSLLCMTAGSFAKENAVTFIAIIPLTIFFFVEKKKIGDIFISTIPLFIAVVFFFIIRTICLGGFSSQTDVNPDLLNNPLIEASPDQHWATISYCMMDYLRLSFFPHPLTWDYYPYHIPIVGWDNYYALAGLIIWGFLLIYSTISIFRRRTLVAWSVWVFFAPLFPASNIPFEVGAFMAERFIFISSIGVCLVVAWFLIVILPKWLKGAYKPSIVILTIILILFEIRTFTRNPAWKDSTTLITTDVKTSVHSAKTLEFFAGDHAGKAKYMYAVNPENIDTIRPKCIDAICYYHEALKYDPYIASSWKNIAEMWCLYGDHHVEAINAICETSKLGGIDQDCMKVMDTIRKTVIMQYENNILVEQPEAILNSLKAANAVNDKLPQFLCLQGYMQNITGDYEGAIISFLKAIRIDINPENYAGLIRAYTHLQDYDNALKYYEETKNNLDDPSIFRAMAEYYESQDDIKNRDHFLELAVISQHKKEMMKVLR